MGGKKNKLNNTYEMKTFNADRVLRTRRLAASSLHTIFYLYFGFFVYTHTHTRTDQKKKNRVVYT